LRSFPRIAITRLNVATGDGAMRIGFVGTGEITQAIVTGISKTDLADTPIHLSPRNQAIAERLAGEHANVTVAADNQAVIDNADLVFLAIRPQVAEEVVRALKFRADHHVISLVAATPLDRLTTWINAPVRLTQAIPLPFVATLNGATAIHPPDEVAASLFGKLGKAIEVSNKTEYDLLGAASALMGTYFGILEAGTKWLENKGLAYESGRAYLVQMFGALTETAAQAPGKPFEDIRVEFSTKGGLNEQVYTNFAADGGIKALSDALDGVFNRIRHSN
jgi:pyrroline-5-carboxylate reductase